MGNDYVNKVVSREPCPLCRAEGRDSKGDNRVNYEDGHGYCYSCNVRFPSPTQSDDVFHNSQFQEPEMETNTLVEPRGTVSEIKDRKISKKICEKYDVKLAFNQEAEVIAHYYPYYHKDTNELIGYKEIQYYWN